MTNLYDHFRDISKEVVDIAKGTDTTCFDINFVSSLRLKTSYLMITKKPMKQVSVDEVTKPTHNSPPVQMRRPGLIISL